MMTTGVGCDRDAVHRRCLAARSLKAGAEWEVCAALVEALRSGVWESFGMTSVIEYADQFIGMAPKATLERLRVGRELESLPRIAEALREGALSWSVVREVTRVARPGRETQWLEKAKGLSMREIEELVAVHEPGDGPDDPPSGKARRHRVVIEMEADEYALYREALGALEKDTGGALREGQALALMARTVLGGPGDDGRSSYQVHMTVCEGCAKGWQEGRGRQVAVAAGVVERALCDAQVVGEEGPATQGIPPATRRRVMRRDHGRCRVPGCRLTSWVDVHHIQLRSEGGDHEESNLIVTCEAHHTAIHEGRLIVEGRAPEVDFLHADGSRYGEALAPSRADVFVDVFSAMKNLGCQEGAARRAIERVRPHVGRDAQVEDVLRHSLAALRAG